MTLWASILKRMKLIKEMKQQSGSILVISALMLPIMLGCLGFAYDFGNLYIHKSRLQNIADAAALAGGRAYLDSQKKPIGDKDQSDDMPPISENYQGIKMTYRVGSTPAEVARDSVHADADAAADRYILNNIKNLGTSVTSDKFSHFALKTEGMSGRVFYRIGLYEMVPMHFLPVIGMDKEQKVRAGAIALIDDGLGIGAGKALFDNLFVVKDGISLGSTVGVDAQGNINGTFDGGIVFATGKDFEADDISGVNNYFYTLAEKNYQAGNNLSVEDLTAAYPNMGGKAVWDNSIPVDNSVSGFIDKLHKLHLDLKKYTVNTTGGVLNDFRTANIGRHRNDDRLARDHSFTVMSGGNVTHYLQTDGGNGENNQKLVFCYPRSEEDSILGQAYWLCYGTQNVYYVFKTEGYKFNNNGTICNTYVTDEQGNQIFCNRLNNNNQIHFDFYRKNVTYDAQGLPKVEYKKLETGNGNNKHALTKVTDERNFERYSYRYPTANDEIIYFTVKKVEYDFSGKRQINEPQIKYSNIFHWEQEGEKELKITVDEKMAGGDYEPFYLILTGGVGSSKKEFKAAIKIKVNVSNERPFIFCNLTENEITEFSIKPGAAFKGVIYSPYAKVVNTAYTNDDGIIVTGSRKSFKGNIIAKELEIQDGDVSWAGQNFLADDSDLKNVSDEAAKAQDERKQKAISKVQAALATYGVNAANWSDPEYFHSLSDEKKIKIKNAWNAYREELWEETGLDMPDWPWKEGGKPTDPDQHHYSVEAINSDISSETLRLTNFRTEYTIEPYINPFNNLVLGEDD